MLLFVFGPLRREETSTSHLFDQNQSIAHNHIHHITCISTIQRSNMGPPKSTSTNATRKQHYKRSSTVIIFDWDDTICPSTFVDQCQIQSFSDFPLHVSRFPTFILSLTSQQFTGTVICNLMHNEVYPIEWMGGNVACIDQR